MKTLVHSIQMLLLVWQLDLFSETLTLQKAIDQKKVAVKVVGLGGHSGTCAEIAIKSLSKNALCVEVEAGRRLNSLKDAEQDLLIVKDYTVELRGGETKKLTVKAYCCQADHCSPMKGSNYEVNKIAELPLYLLARYLNANNYDGEVEQKAVWAISNNRSAATIAGKEDSLLKPLREMVANIKGEVLPWYSLFTTSYTLSDGSIHSVALELKGDMKYSNERDCYMTLNILNDQGMPVCMVKCEWLKPCTNGKYPLSIPVKTLPKGKYTIEMSCRDYSIARQNFEI